MQDNREKDEVIRTSETEAQSAYTENENTEDIQNLTDSAESGNDNDAASESNPDEKESIDVELSEEITPFEENQFIIPDNVEFFITESESAESITDVGDSNDSSESALLDVEHFHDYKSASQADYPSSEAEGQEEHSQSETTSYENLTILNDSETEEGANEPIQEKNKYENPDGKEYDAKNPRKVDGRFDFLELFVFTLVAVMIITTFIFRHSVVEGPSMQNTLQDGEHLIISNLFYTPKKGDIIVCQDYETGHKNPIVKRIIAVEGDTVEILPDGSVFVNGQLQKEDYVFIDPGEVDDFPGMSKVTVPENMVFVMGDHRNKSSDSREFLSTFVREDAILGKVVLRFYPFDKFGTVN